MDSDSLKTVAKTGKKRLWQRRWASICKDCGCPIIFLDNSQPAVPGKRWSPWTVVELYGQRDGELLPWGGEIAYDPARHVKHADCPRVRRRLAWILRQKEDDI
jgi:hypothetical protein